MSADAAPSGALGAAITMVPSATQFKAEAMHPTGVRLPAGLPVRIVATGEIRRKATSSFVEACVRLAPFCETTPEVQEMANTGLPPWGDETWFGDRRGFAQLWWNGPGAEDGSTLAFQQDQPVITMAWPGGELWAGHSFWECYWYITNPDYTHDEGDCWEMSGSWTIAVVPDDGSETDPKTGQPIAGTAKLTATLTSTVDGDGFHLKGVARATDDAVTLEDQHWVYVADAPPPAMMAASRHVVGASTASQAGPGDVDHEAESRLPYVRHAPGLGAARTARASAPPRQAAASTAASEQFLTSCDYQSSASRMYRRSRASWSSRPS